MAFTFVAGDLARIGAPTSANAVGAPGLYLVLAVSGANLTVTPAEGGGGPGDIGIVIRSSRVTSHWASA